jgi:LAO/AO transport system kinase
VKSNGFYDRRRREQARYWMYEGINESLKDSFYDNAAISSMLPKCENEVLEGRKESFEAAEELIELYRKSESAK